MWFLLASSCLLLFSPALGAAEDSLPLVDRAQRYLVDLIKIDTSDPPGNETKAAEYLRQVATANGIPFEMLGDNPKRLTVLAECNQYLYFDSNAIKLEPLLSCRPSPSATSHMKRTEP